MSCTTSNVLKLTPTAMGPLTQFMLRPLPRTTPSVVTMCRMVPRMHGAPTAAAAIVAGGAEDARSLHAPAHHVQRVGGRLAHHARARPERQPLVGGQHRGLGGSGWPSCTLVVRDKAVVGPHGRATTHTDHRPSVSPSNTAQNAME
ncbi:LOW QUALITY PROTEIN: hypothetical protein CRUP_026539 [Coryphaenoides rupestris]|nr:LOW QUALITY PROTEIN: hypothetical protein CRUP_026539 [Coryphaenoides rupestris]